MEIKTFNGGYLRGLRLDSGLTQVQLAQKLGTSQNVISQWENEVWEPDRRFLLALSTEFGVPMDLFFARDVRPTGQK